MITLFQDGSQLRALQFFTQNRARVTLLATPQKAWVTWVVKLAAMAE